MKKQSGFTLAELTVVLAVISILTVSLTPNFTQKIRENKSSRTAQEIAYIIEAAHQYVSANSKWPDQASSCAGAFTTLQGAGQLQGMDNKSPWYDATNNPTGVYTTSCTSSEFKVSVDSNTDWAGYIANYLPATTVSGKTTTTTAPLPSSVPALLGLLPLDGSRAMTGDLDMGTKSIKNATDVAASTVTASTSISTATLTASGNITSSGTVSGATVTSSGNITASGTVSGSTLSSSGSITAAGSVTATGDINSSSGNVYGNDTYIRGKGVWAATSIHDAQMLWNNATISKPSCPHGSAQIFLAPAMASANSSGESMGAIQTWADNNGSYWTVHLRVLTKSGWTYPNSTYGRIAVFTKC